MGVPGYWRYPEAFIVGRWNWTMTLVFTTRSCCERPCNRDGLRALWLTAAPGKSARWRRPPFKSLGTKEERRA